jgi:hypothetical protein
VCFSSLLCHLCAERVREYEDVVNVAKRRWQNETLALTNAALDFQEKTGKVVENAPSLGRSTVY